MEDLQEEIQAANTPIFGLDLSLAVTIWNKKAAAVFGFAATHPTGGSFLNLVHRDQREAVESAGCRSTDLSE